MHFLFSFFSFVFVCIVWPFGAIVFCEIIYIYVYVYSNLGAGVEALQTTTSTDRGCATSTAPATPARPAEEKPTSASSRSPATEARLSSLRPTMDRGMMTVARTETKVHDTVVLVLMVQCCVSVFFSCYQYSVCEDYC